LSDIWDPVGKNSEVATKIDDSNMVFTKIKTKITAFSFSDSAC